MTTTLVSDFNFASGSQIASITIKVDALAPIDLDGMVWIAGNAEGGAPIAEAYREAVDADLHVYVLSNILASEPWPHETIGDDDNDGLTKNTPLYSIDGVRKMVGKNGIEGKRIIVNMGGGVTFLDNSPGASLTVDELAARAAMRTLLGIGAYDSGQPASVTNRARIPSIDPWDGRCTQMRQYNVRQIWVGGSECFNNSWCFRGPRQMMLIQAASAVHVENFEAYNELGVANQGKTRWRSYAGLPGALRGYYLRALRGGVEVTQPIPICGSDASYFYTEHGNYFNGQGIYELTDTYEIVQRAAEFIPTAHLGDTGGADGISIRGDGAFDIHSRLTDSLNPRWTFERVGFENANIWGKGLSFETCYFYHQMAVRGGWVEFSGCQLESQLPLVFEGETRGAGPATATTEIQEYAGRRIGSDPIFPAIAGPSIFIWGGGGMRIGSDHACGIFRVWKGFSCVGGIVITGKGSAFVMPPSGESHSVHIRDATVAIHCRAGGSALIEPNTLNLLNCTAALKVGIGATVAMGTGVGQFSEAAGWNGNFSRHLEGTSTHPLGDQSSIRDASVWG